MYSAYKLNKQGDNIQPWRTPSPIWNQSVVPCPVLTVASWPAYRFLKRQVRWSGIPIMGQWDANQVHWDILSIGKNPKVWLLNTVCVCVCVLSHPMDYSLLGSSIHGILQARILEWKRLWCWEGLGAGGEGDARGWDGWMASLTWWTWVWVNSGSWWWTGRPGVPRFMGSQRVRHDWATELNWLPHLKELTIILN